MSKEKQIGIIPGLLAIAVILLAAAVFAVYFEEQLFSTKAESKSNYELRVAKAHVQADPYSFVARVNLGWVFFLKGDYATALIELEKALELEPEDQTIYYFLGLTYMELGQLQEAEECLLKSLELTKFPNTLLIALGDLYLRQQKYDEALSYYQEALWLYSNSVDLYLKMAEAYQGKGMNLEAEKLYEKVSMFAPELVDELRSNFVERKR